MTSDKMVSIVIVNYNGKTHLEKCLQSIMKINYTLYEVIVVDNNSTDGSVELVQTEYPKVKIIKLDRNYGFAEPNNIGAKNAKGEYLLFLNNDTVVTPDFITELVNAMNQDPQIGICQSLLLKPNGDVDSSGDYLNAAGLAFSAKDKVETARQILSAKGASMLVRKEMFKDLGGFDEKFFLSFEDVDLGCRAWIWGYKVILVPNSKVYHIGGQTVKKLGSVIKFHGVKNILVINLANFEISRALNNIFLLIIMTLTGKSELFFRGNSNESTRRPSFSVIFQGLFWILRNLNYVRAKRKQVNSRRIRTTDELIKMGLITKSMKLFTDDKKS